ncbi:hypothetical protein CDAR_269131 [Caerostris darwini]|uniref:Uncharacterized protein n=1 Tax=Caerostris darwini TaxID=1538125 RepID=A0AAV4MU62_9ARAC|nr:hypothetical protein CDAR_269131 [Caerostris darwini]
MRVYKEIEFLRSPREKDSLDFSHNSYIIQEGQLFCHGLLQHTLARTQSTHGSDPKSQKSHSPPYTKSRRRSKAKKWFFWKRPLIEALQEDAGVLFLLLEEDIVT